VPDKPDVQPKIFDSINYINSNNLYHYDERPSTVPNEEYNVLHQFRKVNYPYDGTGLGVYDRFGVRK
jgi:hypothetical protein